ncbi:hypothetical protein J2T55_000032 [Methylohalomonas lacus]|uniref:Glycine zipper domain-containing protein n=1 Tax=Methylohalomonas lacus TaxID=398773 RepID=A0AAE3HGR7_9GAMM|nr:hypothetical protein [Methylohalomonas lacus]MCS3902040.1 hypothetical protein [Methylohalomonas lacus]
MKTRLLAFLGLILLSAPAFADHRHDQSIDSAIGGGLGGALGGFLGAELGDRDGGIIGAGAGAALGAAYNTRDTEPRRYYAHDRKRYGKYHHEPRYKRHDRGHGHGQHFCPPGQAKKGRC